MSLDYRHVMLLAVVAGGCCAALLAPAFPQHDAYHQFADQRLLWGIPLAADVGSNLGFILAGLMGARQAARLYHLPSALRGWLVLYCVALVATGCGSIYYHLAPDNTGLFWDRLPMTITFSLFFCMVLAAHISLPLAKKCLLPMLGLGLLAALHWRITELQGAGDLRWYAAFQFLPLLLVILMLAMFECRWLRKRWLVATVLAYLVAKLFEMHDADIYGMTGFVSGHTLKHLAAALGAWWVIQSARAAPEPPASQQPLPDFATDRVHPAHNLHPPEAPALPPDVAESSRTGA